jgi:hypothetical protein
MKSKLEEAHNEWLEKIYYAPEGATPRTEEWKKLNFDEALKQSSFSAFLAGFEVAREILRKVW